MGRLVHYAVEKGKALRDLSLDEYKSSSHLFEEDVYNVTAETSIAARNVPGGTAPEQVAQQLARVRKIVQGGDG
jgi:argininosuccinate lyase